MSLAEKILAAWDKTMETGDTEHLSEFLSDDFVFINNVLEHPKIWWIWDEALKRYELTKQKTIK